MLFKSTFNFSLLSFSIVSSWCFAEENINTENIEVIEIHGKSYRSTGTKSGLTPMESPMSFEIYDNKLLQLRQVDSVNEALRYVPGVTPESRGVATLFDQYSIRGFESYRNYYDGLPLQYNLAYNLAPQVDAFATESVEVLKGPTSVLYGSAPPGGMVNQTAKIPQQLSQHAVRARLGTNNLAELALDSTGAMTENVNYRFIALGRSRDGQQVTTEEQRTIIAPSMTFEIGDKTSLNLNIYYQDDPNMLPSSSLPGLGTVYAASYGKLDADAYAGDKNWTMFEREISMVGYKFNHEFDNNSTFLQNFRYTQGESTLRNTYGKGLADGDKIYKRSAYQTIEDIEGFVVDNQYALQLNTGSIAHNLLIGFEYQTLDSTFEYNDTFGNNTPAIDLSQPDYELFVVDQLPLDTYHQFSRLAQQQRGVYIQNELSQDAFTAIMGLRYDDFSSLSDDNEGGYESETHINQHELSMRLAAIYTLDNGLAPYLSYSESFEPTAGKDSVTGKAFKPTTASQIEAGIKYQNESASTRITAAIFDLNKQNMVTSTPDFMKKTQSGEVKSKGIEISIFQQINDSADITANMTQLDISVTKNPNDPSLIGKTPIWVAEQQASLWLNYYVSADFELNGGVRYVGESQLDKHNSDVIAPYTLIDFAASYDFSDQYQLGLAVSNLTDKRYVGSCVDIRRCWMGAERSIELTLNASF
ncbi:TonB-dependent siderophore receptor [Pseudoalteromonas ulvae]|uniref:TonB-dependent siderophore receptor n=1 Tax=Pseudoalteromonas ulvae TaxID=107327 RepID=A0A2C9ZZS8_PSEDV|nr:TonB-dependent siderophore receptor [Pseudoalteromonas ulvae]OUL56272.1 TonB-dependent siderophore receptor [Pseudoalteromonas ulvae]